jgi:putative FmdB family regulatory protein
MPLYEYTCRRCDHSFELLVKRWDSVVRCPACQDSDVEKQLSSFSCITPSAPPTPCASGCCAVDRCQGARDCASSNRG